MQAIFRLGHKTLCDGHVTEKHPFGCKALIISTCLCDGYVIKNKHEQTHCTQAIVG
jgi:hypothetical protein